MKREGNVSEENDRIVVTLVQGNPRERTRVAYRPLRQNRGLPVPRWSGQDRNRFSRCAQAVDERCPRNGARTQRRDVNLRLDHIELRRRRALQRLPCALPLRVSGGRASGLLRPSRRRRRGGKASLRDRHRTPSVAASPGVSGLTCPPVVSGWTHELAMVSARSQLHLCFRGPRMSGCHHLYICTCLHGLRPRWQQRVTAEGPCHVDDSPVGSACIVPESAKAASSRIL